MVEFIHSQYSDVFAGAFIIALIAGLLFGFRKVKKIEVIAAIFSAMSAIGLVYTGSFIALIVLWETLMLASVMLIFSGGTKAAGRAGLRYFILHSFGGVLLLTGIAIHLVNGGGEELSHFVLTEVTNLASLAPWLMLVAVLINCAVPPLSAWLPDAYPEATPYGTIFLSAFTTKSAVFVLMMLFAGNEVLVWLGLLMVFYGGIYALLENDIRRMLSYSIISAVGFMVAGVGISEMALAGVALLAFTHIIYKALLLMVTANVIEATGKQRFTDLGGLYNQMKFTAVLAIIAAAISTALIPLTSSFIAKSFISMSAHDNEHYSIVYYLIILGSVLTALTTGLKFPYFIFFGRKKTSVLKTKKFGASRASYAAMLMLVILSIPSPLLPNSVYNLLLIEVNQFYTVANITKSLGTYVAAALVFFLLPSLFKPRGILLTDFDWIYRVFLRNVLQLLNKLYENIYNTFVYLIMLLVNWVRPLIIKTFAHHGYVTQNWSTGTSVTFLTVLLAVVLLVYYL